MPRGETRGGRGGKKKQLVNRRSETQRAVALTAK